MDQITQSQPNNINNQQMFDQNKDDRSSDTFCTTIAIVGRPNAGKSTLFNHIMQQTLSIATHKVQTTRVSVRGVLNIDQVQLVFVDTPGMFKPGANKRLEKYIVNNAYSSLKKINIAILLLDCQELVKLLVAARDQAEERGQSLFAKQSVTQKQTNDSDSNDEDDYKRIEQIFDSKEEMADFIDQNRTIIKQIKQKNHKTNVLLVLNKIDLLKVDSTFIKNLENIKQYLQKRLNIQSKSDQNVQHNLKEDLAADSIAKHQTQELLECIGVSASSGDGVEALVAKLTIMAANYSAPWLFRDGKHTDMTERTLAEEITREQLYLRLGQELPYASKVVTDRWVDNQDGTTTIHQSIHVLKQSQKAIVVGSNGEMIRYIGQNSRVKIADLLERKVHLFLHVKVKSDWIDKLR